MSLTMTDLFCGAGGSAQGAHAVPGVDLRIAANHWQLAVDTHAKNFPDADHAVADISQVDPRRFPTTDLLWASPECTNHSQAKGRKRATNQPDLFGETLPDEASERSRATMWDVPRFAERHAYRAVIVENVVDAAKWVMWDAWLMAMTSLGYAHQLVSLNSMHAQATAAPRAPQSRDRLYVVFHRAGDRKPDVQLRPLAWCASCDGDVPAVQSWKPGRKVGRYRQQYVYRCPRPACRGALVEPYALPAAHAIDWSMPGQRIGDKPIKTWKNKRTGEVTLGPLAPATMLRIDAGLRKYAHEATAAPMRTRTARESDALVVPYYGSTVRAQSSGLPMPTMGTVDTAGVAFIAELRGGGSKHRDVREPLATLTASGTHHMLVRHNSSTGPGGEMCTPATEPARTITTAGHQSVVGWPAPAPLVDDCTFRMLEPHEIQKAMAFGDTYAVLGNRREKVRQLGNGVTPPAAEFLVGAVAAALDGAA